MPIHVSDVSWTFVGLMTLLAFITALLGSLIAFRNRFLGAIIAAILFGIGFIAWNYYPHDFGLPVLKSIEIDSVRSGPPTVAPASHISTTPAAPSTPTTPITPTAPTTPATPHD